MFFLCCFFGFLSRVPSDARILDAARVVALCDVPVFVSFLPDDDLFAVDAADVVSDVICVHAKVGLPACRCRLAYFCKRPCSCWRSFCKVPAVQAIACVLPLAGVHAIVGVSEVAFGRSILISWFVGSVVEPEPKP